MRIWAVLTGAGTGIGAALAKELCQHNINVLAIGRRLEPLLHTKQTSQKPDLIHPLAVDISSKDGRKSIVDFIPHDDSIAYLIQNAAVGVPSKLVDLKEEDFEYAMAVNVTAPLMLTKHLFSRMRKCKGRIIHLGTGVAFKAQFGTATYGITKMAFHRLYEQLRVELEGTEVQIASVLPGVVETEGLREHIGLANEHKLAHVAYFDQVEKEGKILHAYTAAKFLKYVLMDTNKSEFSKEWNIHDSSHWSFWKF